MGAGPRVVLRPASSRVVATSLVDSKGNVNGNACYCEPVGHCQRPDPGGRVMCPKGSHVDPNACRERRVFQTIVGAGCHEPEELPPPPEKDPPQAKQSPGLRRLDEQEDVDQSACADKDKLVNHFILHFKDFQDNGTSVTCRKLKEMGMCDNLERPSLTEKVRQECPCSCGVSPRAPPTPPPLSANQSYANKLRKQHRCWRDDWNWWDALELSEPAKGSVIVSLMDRNQPAGCGVNKSPWRWWWACPQGDHDLRGSHAPDPWREPSGPLQGCTTNPAYDDGVRIGSELIEVDGDKYDWRTKWGKDILQHLDKAKCHQLVFSGPDPTFRWWCLNASNANPSWKKEQPWAPEGCRGSGNECPAGTLCCVKHKTLQRPEDLYRKRCGKNGLCKDMGACKTMPGTTACMSRVVSVA